MRAIDRWGSTFQPCCWRSRARPFTPRISAGQTSRRRVELVTTDVVVRDSNGQFISDLKKEEFEVLEDGVPPDS